MFLPRFNYSKLLLAFTAVILLTQCAGEHQASSENETAETEPLLFEQREDTGIDFANNLAPSAEWNILTYLYYYNGAGVAAGDFNQDGLIDLYFTGNQVPDRLYLNQGDFKFQDITQTAGIKNAQGWTSGVTLVDVNADGLLDIYLCKLGEYRGVEGKNQLWLNLGMGADDLPRFEEKAADFGLDVKAYSTQAAFFDQDKDGDLDLFLLNHSVHPNRTYGLGRQREMVDPMAGDRFYRNEKGKFIDRSAEAGIFQGRIGYGLGLGISDLNNDGYPDVYVGNDFFENDYLYLNQKDGTFSEVIHQDGHYLGHTSHFSMGNDLADLNNDGLIDLVSVDMLPKDLSAFKRSGTEYNNQIYHQYLQNGYRPQYMQNTLHLNQGNHFSEMAYAAGVSATDWSWAPLLVDFDNDGLKDIFITNGILGATNDMDFMKFIANEKIQKKINEGMANEDLAFTKELPERKLKNFFFKNGGQMGFKDVSHVWSKQEAGFSNGATYADLDNDGDMDLVINEVNAKASLLENKTDSLYALHFLKIRLKGSKKNPEGLGARLEIHHKETSFTQELYRTRGYLSATSGEILFGLGDQSQIDSLVVFWPEGERQVLHKPQLDQKLVITKQEDLKSNRAFTETEVPGPNRERTDSRQKEIDWRHSEPTSFEFGREPLIPYGKGYEGPSLAVADVNGDGKEDLYLGGGRNQTSLLLLQGKQGQWLPSSQPDFEQTTKHEETASVLFDADADGDPDLLVAFGGNEQTSGPGLQPRLFLNNKGKFELQANFPTFELNAGAIQALDLDKDGDLDLLLGANSKPQAFGEKPKNYVLLNQGKGQFVLNQSDSYAWFKEAGAIEDLLVIDLNGDGAKDLVAVGHWQPIRVFLHTDQWTRLDDPTLTRAKGLWNAVASADLDQDGRLDLIVGNWGLNSRFKASEKTPMKLYVYDFNGNGKNEALVTYFEDGRETTFASKDDLAKQIPQLNKNFLSYADFADASMEELFGKEKLEKGFRAEVNELAHCVFLNKKEGFEKKILPFMTQLSSVKAIYLGNFDEDHTTELLLGGNDFQISTQLGRQDGTHGQVLWNFSGDGQGEMQSLDIPGLIREIKSVDTEAGSQLIFLRNGDYPHIIPKQKIKKQKR